MKIGILSSGGDAPGINATIRAIGKTAIHEYGAEVIGFKEGFSGVLSDDVIDFGFESLTGLLMPGGTILGTNRDKPLREKLLKDRVFADQFVTAYHRQRLNCIFAIGGNGTQKTAAVVSSLGINVIGIPKTIDNDIWGTEVTFGFDTAVDIATDAIDRIHSTATSHNRVMLVEVMGHDAGWIALHAGMASGADIILLPELGYDLEVIRKTLRNRVARGKKHSIIVVAEGLDVNGKRSPSRQLSKVLSEEGEFECRETVLGYVQRGGSPSAYDRNLCTRLGGYATELLGQGIFGVMVCMRAGEVGHIPLCEVSDKLKRVPEDHPLIVQGRRMGISFGIE